MTLRQLLFLALLPWLFGLAGPTAAMSAPRQPTDKWAVDFGAAQCVASRAYGTAEAPLYFGLKAPPVGEVMQILVMREGRASAAEQVRATISIDGHETLKTNMLMFSPQRSKFRAYMLNMPLSDFAAVRKARTLAIRAEGLNESFSISNMEPLLRVMNKCVVDLRRIWNVTDPLGERSPLAKRATGNLARFVSDEDYPAIAIRRGESGQVRFAMLIDETGRVADCTVIETSGVAALDAQTCAIMGQRVKLQPALGQDGKPAKDAAVQQIRWVMPN